MMWRSPPGLCWVAPSAMPRGMMLIRWGGATSGEKWATTACPDSWMATRRRSFPSSFVSRRSPSTTLSSAPATSSAVVLSRPARVQLGAGDHDAAIEAAGAQQRGIQHVGTVRRRDDDDQVRSIEAVHLREELVQRLLALVVAAAQARPARAAHGVDLVDEDDGGRPQLRLLEQIAHTRGAQAHEQLDELRRADGIDRHARLTRHRARQQRLAGAGGADQPHAARRHATPAP